MTTLYSQKTFEAVCTISEAAAMLAVVRWPDRYFYYIDEPQSVDAAFIDPDYLKPGGTC